MEEEQKMACIQIMENLLKLPISQMFWDLRSSDSEKENFELRSFRNISYILNNDFYQSPYEWLLDMRKAFATAVLNSKFDDLRSKAAQQLSIQFENEILKFTPTFPPSVIKFQRIVGELDEYLKKACPDFPEHVPLESKPAAEVFKNSSYSIDNVQKLSNDIRILKAQPLILRVAAFVYSIQPEAVIVDSGISIILTSLNEENLVRLRSFVDDLMYKAATGVIRPYVRTPGMKSASLIVK